jgi:8-oxo-dGTP diphosphatase
LPVRGLVFYKDKVLFIRESSCYGGGTNIGRYDLIGGKVAPGESVHDALLREAREETSLPITIIRPFHVDEWRPVIQGQQFQIVGIFFECTTSTDEVTLSSDHDEYVWIDPSHYTRYDLIAPQRAAFQAYLQLYKISS